MNQIAELHRFNAWANRSLLTGLRQLTPTQLVEQQEGMYRTILGVVGHLAGVEAGYLRLMGGGVMDVATGSLEDVAGVLERTGHGLVELASKGDLEATFHVPWFKRDFTIFQGLSQVLTHSINHRADVNGWLPRFGVESTDQDYFDLVLEG
jgi:uncharacterized damage-inducible protein DinB